MSKYPEELVRRAHAVYMSGASPDRAQAVMCASRATMIRHFHKLGLFVYPKSIVRGTPLSDEAAVRAAHARYIARETRASILAAEFGVTTVALVRMFKRRGLPVHSRGPWRGYDYAKDRENRPHECVYANGECLGCGRAA